MGGIDFVNKTDDSLEGERDAAPDGAGGLHEVHGSPVAADDRHIALGQQVADIEQGFHVSGSE